MKKGKLFIGLIVILVLFSLSAFAQNKTAALIVNSELMPIGFDQVMHDRLETIGYDVKVVPSADIPSWFDVDSANAFDLLLISESIGSSAADPLIGTTTPTMHNEAYGWDNWYATTPASIGWVDVGNVDIVNDTHPIAVDAGVSAGSVSFFSPPTGATGDFVSALAPGAELIGKIESAGNSYAMIFTIDKGAELADSSAAPARFAGFSIPGDKTFTANAMTDVAWALWDATIKWLTDASVNGIDDKSVAATPAQFELAQNFPNPFNPTTLIQYTLGENTKVEIAVYDLLGHKVATLMNGHQNAGSHRVVWDASGASAGVYLCQMKTNDLVESKKMLLVK